MKWLRQFLLGNAVAKTIVSTALSVVTGFLGGTLVLEITKPGETVGLEALDWSRVPKAFSFWGLVAAIVVVAIYNVKVSRYESNQEFETRVRELAFKVLGLPVLQHFKRETEAGRLTPMSDVLKILGLNGGGR